MGTERSDDKKGAFYAWVPDLQEAEDNGDAMVEIRTTPAEGYQPLFAPSAVACSEPKGPTPNSPDADAALALVRNPEPLIDAAMRAFDKVSAPQSAIGEISEAMIDKALRASIPGGSNAEDWFMPHEKPKQRQNIRDVVRCMLNAVADRTTPEDK